MCSNIDHADSNDLVIPQRPGQGYDYSHKCYRFLTHPENRPENAEKQHYKYNDYVSDTSLPYKRIPLKFPYL